MPRGRNVGQGCQGLLAYTYRERLNQRVAGREMEAMADCFGKQMQGRSRAERKERKEWKRRCGRPRVGRWWQTEGQSIAAQAAIASSERSREVAGRPVAIAGGSCNDRAMSGVRTRHEGSSAKEGNKQPQAFKRGNGRGQPAREAGDGQGGGMWTAATAQGGGWQLEELQATAE